MKYKRQLISSMFAIALLAGGSNVYAADTTVGNTKMVQQINQIKMKPSHEGLTPKQKSDKQLDS